MQNLKFLEEVELLDVETLNIQKASPLKACQDFKTNPFKKAVGNKKKYCATQPLAIQGF